MPCCIERMRFSPRLAIRKNNKNLLFFHFYFFAEFGTSLFQVLSAWHGTTTLGWVAVPKPAGSTTRGWVAVPMPRGFVCFRFFAAETPWMDLLANFARAKLLKPAGHGGESYLLGLLAKIKCSICSYQLNLWYVAHGVT